MTQPIYRKLWASPVSSCSFLEEPILQEEDGGRASIDLSWTGIDHELITSRILFLGVVSIRRTAFSDLSRDAASSAYDELVERVNFESSSSETSISPTKLREFRLRFDDSDCYDVLCERVQIDGRDL